MTGVSSCVILENILNMSTKLLSIFIAHCTILIIKYIGLSKHSEKMNEAAMEKNCSGMKFRHFKKY